MFKKQLIVIAIVDCMSYCYSDVSVSMYLIVIHSDSNVGSLFKRCFTPVMSVHSSMRPLLCVCSHKILLLAGFEDESHSCAYDNEEVSLGGPTEHLKGDWNICTYHYILCSKTVTTE